MPVRLPRILASVAILATIAAGCGDDARTSAGGPTSSSTTMPADSTPTGAADERAAEERTLTGDITIRGVRELSPISPSSRVIVRVEDISLPDVASVVLGERTYEDVANLPLSYEVTWTPSADTGPDISVSVRIQDGDELTFISDTVNPVPTSGGTVDVEVVSTATAEPDTTEGAQLAASVVGLGEDEAGSIIAGAGFTARVTGRDGEPLLGTTDYRLDRINLEIADGIVVGASVG